MVEEAGVGAKAEVTSGFVSMFRQAQHIAGSTNLGGWRGRSLSLRSLSLSKGRKAGGGGSVGVREFPWGSFLCFDTLRPFDKLKAPQAQRPGRGQSLPRT